MNLFDTSRRKRISQDIVVQKNGLKENEVLFGKAQWFMMDADVKNKGFIKASSPCYKWVNEKLNKGKGW